MGFAFGAPSRAKFKGVHPDLVRVFERAIQLSEIDFRVTQGVRTVAEQKKLLAAGASRTMKSRHIPSTNRSGLAEAMDVVALVGGKVRWDWPLYPKIAEAVRKASDELGIPVTWGGSWPRFRDGPHFELTRGKVYG
ncbi:MAG TPA: M15 family metallopeptidase [Microvirga sp.]|jgi:peptidoglycan L-alanyl-D-glutamate endopeptidase CwlK|nr:M15 family metallopeptidase [Microvirga sp.]